MLAVVVACLFLVASIAFSFHFVMRSTAVQVRLIERQMQARTLTDMASDALHVAMEDHDRGRPTSCDSFLNGLMDRLDAGRATPAALGAGKLDVTDTLLVNPLVLELLGRAGLAGEASPDASIVEARLGPFHVAPGQHDAHVYYAEPLFGDAAKDTLPWDLRCPVHLQTEVTTLVGPFGSHQIDALDWQTALTDTTPVACEHALFAYQPPAQIDTALNDLQRGGRFTVYAGASGRVMVRGPLLLQAEDGVAAGKKPCWGGPAPVLDSLSYTAAHWSGWAAIPGPRAVQLPPGAIDKWVVDAAGAVLSWLGISSPLADYGPMRPDRDDSPGGQIGPITFPFPDHPLTAGPWSFWLSILVGPGLGNMVGFFYPIFPDDQIARYDPGDYFYGPLLSGRQLFSILGQADAAPPGPGQPTSRDMYKGILVHGKGAVDEAMARGEVPWAGEDDDAVLPEPVPATDPAQMGELGILGLYGVAAYDNADWFAVGLADLISWAFPPAKAAEVTIKEILKTLGMDPDIYFIFRSWWVDGRMDAPGSTTLTAEQVKAWCDAQSADLIPYGVHYFSHDFYEPRHWEKFALDMGLGAAISFLTSKIPEEGKRIYNEEKVKLLDSTLEKGVKRWLNGVAGKIIDDMIGRIWNAAVDIVLKVVVKDLLEEELHRSIDRILPKVPTSPLAVGGPAERILAAYPKGFFPSKFREFDEIVTRTYTDMESYLLEEQVEGDALGTVLELHGAVRILSADYHGPPIRYRGRGILVVASTSVAAPATIDAAITPADDRSRLVLVHLIDPALAGRADVPMLRLGPEVAASVVSETGVVPASGRGVVIRGNLVCGQIYKSRIDAGLTGPSEGVHVVYAPEYGAGATGSRAPFWTVELVSGLDAIDQGP